MEGSNSGKKTYVVQDGNNGKDNRSYGQDQEFYWVREERRNIPHVDAMLYKERYDIIKQEDSQTNGAGRGRIQNEQV